MTAPAGYRESDLYSEFPVHREFLVKLQAAKRDGLTPGPIDLSADNVAVHLRFCAYPLATPGAFDRDYTMTKVMGKTKAGDTGIVQVSVNLPAARELVHVEWVAVQTDSAADASTPSGKAETALSLPWIARAVAMASPA